VPAAQLEHADAAAAEYLPATQLTHSEDIVEPTVAEYMPATQLEQVEAPELAW